MNHLPYHFYDPQQEIRFDRFDLPAPWINYLSNGRMHAFVSQAGGGMSWWLSPMMFRLTRYRFYNMPIDSPGFYVYLRDNEDGDYFSISWQPVGKDLKEAAYRCRHGLSYSVYECEYKGLRASQKMFIPLDDDAMLWDVTVTNESGQERDISMFSYLEFSWHHIMIDNQNFQMSLYCAGSSCEDGIIEHDLFYEEFGYEFFTADFEPDGFD
jgi:N,N'-diacetylchitobiose phosphorylase